MGRGRGKGKKQTIIAAREDSGEEEKIPVKRRGRPQKTLKDEVEEEEEEESEKIEGVEEDDENTKNSLSNKDPQNRTAIENGRKRKRPSQVNEILESVKEENGVGTKTNTSVPNKSVGFRQNGSRRKNKPRRAAEVGVECT